MAESVTLMSDVIKPDAMLAALRHADEHYSLEG